MAKSENQKIKLLKIYDILRTESDEEHPMGTNDLLERLRDEGIRCERKALASDIALLNLYGYGILPRLAGPQHPCDPFSRGCDAVGGIPLQVPDEGDRDGGRHACGDQ